MRHVTGRSPSDVWSARLGRPSQHFVKRSPTRGSPYMIRAQEGSTGDGRRFIRPAAQARFVSMRGIAPTLAEDQHFVLSSLPPTLRQKRLALGIVLALMVALYLVIGPLGGVQWGAIHSFVAVYTTGMFVTDSITAILLYSQFSILRSRAILVIASGYLFTAFLIVPYVLAFPGVLAPNGVVGGLQTSADLYLIWHCGFPRFVIGYALSKDAEPSRRLSPGKVGSAIVQ